MTTRLTTKRRVKREEHIFVPGTFNDSTVEFVKKRIAFKAKAERVLGTHIFLVGWNTTKINGTPVSPGYPVEQDEATEWLKSDLSRIAESIQLPELDQHDFNETVFARYMRGT